MKAYYDHTVQDHQRHDLYTLFFSRNEMLLSQGSYGKTHHIIHQFKEVIAGIYSKLLSSP